MPDMAAIRAGIAAKLAPLQTAGVTVGTDPDQVTKSVQVSGYQQGNPDLPAIMVMGDTDVDYTEAGRHGVNLEISVQAFVGDQFDVTGQMILDTLMFGDTSVKKLLETKDSSDGAYATLGGSVEDAFVSRMTSHRQLPLQNVKLLGAEWVVLAVLTDS